MQTENYKEEQRLFDQAHTDVGERKEVRRKITEAMRRIGDWFNREFKSVESLPLEFRELRTYDIDTHKDRINNMWSRFL